MNFEFTEDQRALQDVVRRFVEKEMPKSSVASWDEKGEFPVPLLDKMAAPCASWLNTALFFPWRARKDVRHKPLRGPGRWPGLAR